MNIIKYGGSRLSPNEDTYDDNFVESLISLVKKYQEQKFMIIIGGGALCRKRQREALEKNSELSAEEKDWVGIRTTWENAEYVIKKFQEAEINVCSEVIKDPNVKKEGFDVYVAGGYKPGNSTDFVTMSLAKTYGAEKVIKVSDFKVVKDVSPLALKDLSKEDRNEELKKANDLTRATWQKMQDLVGTEWVPGLNTPLDPLAAKLGVENANISLYICQESELEKVFSDSEDFVGTVVSG
jgi:uridylate kinase